MSKKHNWRKVLSWQQQVSDYESYITVLSSKILETFSPREGDTPGNMIDLFIVAYYNDHSDGEGALDHDDMFGIALAGVEAFMADDIENFAQWYTDYKDDDTYQFMREQYV